MIIAVNIGNTNTSFAFKKNQSIERFSVLTHSYQNQKQLIDILEDEDIKISNQKLIVSSVVPTKNKIIEAISPNTVFIKEKHLDRIDTSLYQADSLGIDRLVAMNALAKHQNFILFDFGTATTVNVVKDSTFVGGSIVCGMRTGINALANNTGQLNQTSLTDQVDLLATTTKASLQGGALINALALINYYQEAIEKKFDAPFKIFLTGGNGRYLIKHTEDVEYMPTLIIDYLLTRGDLFEN